MSCLVRETHEALRICTWKRVTTRAPGGWSGARCEWVATTGTALMTAPDLPERSSIGGDGRYDWTPLQINEDVSCTGCATLSHIGEWAVVKSRNSRNAASGAPARM
jgi:hypothetical protein